MVWNVLGAAFRYSDLKVDRLSIIKRCFELCLVLSCSALLVRPCSAQFGGGDTTVGYIDSAVVQNQVRFRFDSSYDNPTPDRAEFLYPKCGCFRANGDPTAPGPPLLESGIDFQEFSLFAETLLGCDLVSGFIDVPFRLINPEQNANTGGISDINVGIKAMLLADDYNYLTFQFRTYIPTGDGFDGLGTEHVTLEPGLLFLKRCGGGTTLEGELRDFIPIDGTAGWAGNVLRYGLGISNKIIETECLSVTPVLETVAWSVLSGDVLVDGVGIESAETTIVNMKVGTRFSIQPQCQCSGTKSLYVGYGKALTDSRWYDDTLRVECRLAF